MSGINRKTGGYSRDHGQTDNCPCAEILGGRIGCRPEQADELQWNNNVRQTAIIEILLQLRDDFIRWITRILAEHPVQEWSNDIVQKQWQNDPPFVAGYGMQCDANKR